MTNGDRLFEKLAKGKAKDRKPVTVYLSRPIFDKFRDMCKEREVSASLAIETLIRDLLDEEDKPKRLNAVKSLDPRIARVLSALSDPATLESVELVLEATAAGNNSKAGSRRKAR